MIGITISGKAYSVIAAMLPGSPTVEQDIAAHGECRLWVPRHLVERLMARREPGETFSQVILRLGQACLLLGDYPADDNPSGDK